MRRSESESKKPRTEWLLCRQVQAKIPPCGAACLSRNDRCEPLRVMVLFMNVGADLCVGPLKTRKGGAGLNIRKLTGMALLTVIALTVFLVEAQIPAPVPIPGIKLGLANIVTVFAVFVLGGQEAALILASRIFLGAVFAGNFSTIFYSAGGGLLALLTTVGLKRVLTGGQLWVAGVLGAVAHSIGQMAVAAALTGTPSLLFYLPVMLVCSIFTGLFTGLCAQLLVNRGKDLWKTFFKCI